MYIILKFYVFVLFFNSISVQRNNTNSKRKFCDSDGVTLKLHRTALPPSTTLTILKKTATFY